MAALLNVQNNVCYLDSLSQRYKLLYPKLSTLTEEEKKEITNIKKEMLETLGQIMSNNCDEVLEGIFKDKLKLLSQGIKTVLNDKTEELDKFTQEQVKASDIISDIASSVCSLETLDSNINIRVDIEKLLFYLKNKVNVIGLIDKKLFALEYLREKLDNYKSGLYKLINLSRMHISKTELNFEEKQEVFDIFSSISFEYHYDANHSKVFNEDLTDKTLNLNTTDYIAWLEKIFIEMLEAVGVNLETYLNEILTLVTDTSATKTNIENYIVFLGKKYDSDIVSFYNSIINKKISCVTEIKKVLRNSLSYEENKDNKYILSRINKTHRLPEVLITSSYKKYLEDILFDFQTENLQKDNIKELLDEISDLMFEKFDPQRYIDIYEYNFKQKNKQINLFTQYLNELLNDAKTITRVKYINNLENQIEENMLNEYNTARANTEKQKKEKDVAILKKALENIADRFSTFDEYSYKKYITSIEEAYEVEGLATEISIRRKSLFSSFKSKKLSKKDLECIQSFLKLEDINKKLVKNLAYDVIIGSDSIRYEVLGKILI